MYRIQTVDSYDLSDQRVGKAACSYDVSDQHVDKGRKYSVGVWWGYYHIWAIPGGGTAIYGLYRYVPL